MSSLSNWLRLCCLLKLIGELNSYVLLAANADDFHNIAKKIVPESLANKLARLASDISVKKNSRGKSKETDYYYESEAEDDFNGNEKDDRVIDNEASDLGKSGEAVYVKEWKTRVNFDELVERVKDRLAKELSEKLKEHVLNPPEGIQLQSIYNNVEQKHVQKAKIKKTGSLGTSFGYNKNSFKPKKTYGYSDSKNTDYPEGHKNTTDYIDTNFQGQEKETYLHKIPKYEHKAYINNQNTEKYEIKVSNNYKATNADLNDYSNEKSKGKYLYENDHEEENDSYHSQTNKELIYGIKEVDLNENYVKNNESPKYTEKYEYKYEENEPIKYVYDDDKVSQKVNTDRNKFAVTDSSKQSLFNEYDLLSNRRNDSYEDYVMPEVGNIFASEETNKPINQDRPRKKKKSTFHNNDKSRFKVQHNGNLKRVVKPLNNEKQHAHNDKITEDYKEITDKSLEIKAKTESLLYNYDDLEPKAIKDDRSKDREIISEVIPTKKPKAKGTMIPTREYFKMASPNYYISLPTVVEKYDSNEPLPEKDREREVIKHFVNPPASINKKVKLI